MSAHTICVIISILFHLVTLNAVKGKHTLKMCFDEEISSSQLGSCGKPSRWSTCRQDTRDVYGYACKTNNECKPYKHGRSDEGYSKVKVTKLQDFFMLGTHLCYYVKKCLCKEMSKETKPNVQWIAKSKCPAAPDTYSVAKMDYYNEEDYEIHYDQGYEGDYDEENELDQQEGDVNDDELYWDLASLRALKNKDRSLS
eukprot:249540_1